MAKRSIVEEALLEAKQLEEALKKNSKEILAATMQRDIDQIVKASLNEDEMADEDEELENESQMEESEDESTSTMVMDEEDELINSEEEDSDDAEEQEDVEAFSDDNESPEYGDEVDVDTDVDTDDAISYDEPEGDDSEVLDMTTASPDKLISVFKLMDDDDEIEVVKTDGGVEIKDNKTGAGYMIKMNESMDYADEDESMSYEDDIMSYDGEDEMMSYDGEDEMMSYEDEDESVGVDYMSHEDTDESMDKLKKMFSITSKDESSCDECGWQENDEPIYEISFEDEDETYHEDEDEGYGSSDEGSRRTMADRRRVAKHPQNYPPSRMDESVNSEYKKVIKEYRELKDKYLQTKDALKVFRDKLSEIAIFNSNLTHAVKLFMEHATTKQEKTGIMKRFDDEAITLKESKRLYKTISNELKDRKPISEKVEKKINESLTKGSSDTLIESKVYVDPQISKIHELMDKLDSRK